MTLPHAISNVDLISWTLSALALFAFGRKTEIRRIFPGLFLFLSVRVIGDAVLNLLLHSHHVLPFSRPVIYDIYASVYYVSFLIASVAIFYTVRQAFDYTMAPLTGLRAAGRILFRWVAIISTIVVLANSIHPYGLTWKAVPPAMIELMRCMSMLELCLLAFLALFIHRLGLSFRSTVFGVGLGLGALAATDMIKSALLHYGSSMYSWANLFGEVSSLLVFAVWCVYFFKPEPVRRSMMVRADSQLLRWNEIALALGHSSGQVVLTPAPSTFFLQDVEKVVDRVMSRNPIDAG